MHNYKNTIIFYFPGLYPCQTGGMEVYNFHLLRNIGNVDWQYNTLCISGCDKIDNRNILPLKDRLFLFTRLGLGTLSTLLYYTFSRIIKWKEVKIIFIPYTSNFEYSAFAFLLLKKIFNVNYVVHIHGGGLKKWKNIILQKSFFKNAIRISGVSGPIVNEYSIRTKRDVHYLPPVIPFKKSNKTFEELKSVKGLERFDKIILFVGSLKTIKSPETLIKAFITLGDEFIKNFNIGLVIVGDGPLREDLQNTYANKSNIVFTGRISNEDVHEYYALSDLYVIPSWFEGTPVSLLEAMFNKLPCIGSNVPGINTIITHKVNGYLFEKDDFKSLRNLIIQLINDKNNCEETGKAAHNFILNNFNYNEHIKEVRNFIIGK